MEGFEVAQTKKLRPTDEPTRIESRENKISAAEKNVRGMFDDRMEEIRAVTSLEYPREQ